jgi:hypothetical protein
VTALLDKMRDDGLGAGTIATNTFRLRHLFQLPANEARPVRWLQHRGAELYRAATVERSADTHHAELGLAKQLGDLAVSKRWLRANPFEKVEPIGRKKHGRNKARLRVDASSGIGVSSTRAIRLPSSRWRTSFSARVRPSS